MLTLRKMCRKWENIKNSHTVYDIKIHMISRIKEEISVSKFMRERLFLCECRDSDGRSYIANQSGEEKIKSSKSRNELQSFFSSIQPRDFQKVLALRDNLIVTMCVWF